MPVYDEQGNWVLYRDLVMGKYELTTDLPACFRNIHCLFIPVLLSTQHPTLIKNKFKLIRYNGGYYYYSLTDDIHDMRKIVTKELLVLIDHIYIGTII